VVNVEGVLSSPQLVLVVALVAVSMCLVWTENSSLHQHERYLRMYFNLNLLKLSNNGLYEEGDNQDEQYN
jgi:hypothetical protein